jgi:integrase
VATIAERRRKDGSVSYLAQITRRGHGHQESRSFDKRKTAEAWAKKREREIDDAIANGRPIKTQTLSNATLGDAIDRYIKDSRKEIGKTKAQVLSTIRKEYDIADMRCDKITSQDIVTFARELHNRPGLDSAATVLNYLSHLSAVFSIARPAHGFQLDKQAMDDAMTVCKKMGFTAKSKKRNRRPSLDELELLLSHFEKRFAHRPKSCPMHKVVVFAIFSTRRQEEICRITWADYDAAGQRVLVRDMKHPGDKVGNDDWLNLPDPCCAIINSMPRISDRIFPFSADALSAAFTRACKALSIDDLHFHDLRHEGASWLSEMGWTPQQVGKVTGHRSWSSLQRYSHLRHTGDKFAGWKWIERVTQ